MADVEIVLVDSAEDIRAAWELEKTLVHTDDNASNKGFLLQGATIQEFEEFAKTALFYIAKAEQQVVGFLIVLPPENKRLVALLMKREQFSSDCHVYLDRPNLYWIAKIGVSRSLAREGISTKLYQHFFESCPDANVITATLIEPIHNKAAEGFHQRMGFQKIGTFDGGDRGELKSCLSSVVFYSRNPRASW